MGKEPELAAPMMVHGLIGPINVTVASTIIMVFVGSGQNPTFALYYVFCRIGFRLRLGVWIPIEALPFPIQLNE